MAARKHRRFFNTQFVTTCISTTLVLILLGTIEMFVLSAHNLSNYVRENINISVLINDEMDSLKIQSLKKSFEKADYIKSLVYISKEEALKEECEDQGTDPSEFLGFNPYTASFEIKVKSEYATNDGMDKIVKKMKNTAGVVDVIYSKDLIKAVNDNIKKISIILLIIAALFTYISFALINNTVQLTIFSKRFTINTMKLVGASWGFIRKPFLWNGVAMGMISATSADVCMLFGIKWLMKYEPQISLIIGWKEYTIVGLTILVCGLLITLLCIYISLNKFLKMSTNKLYYI